MKKVTKTLGVLVLTMFLGFANPVYSQTGDNSPTRSERVDNTDDDDMGKWGLAGLLGLLGLLGLKRNDRDNNRTHSTTTNR
ncbi:MAG: WGxxGxxG family protein [Chitinophagaceae bacterium]